MILSEVVTLHGVDEIRRRVIEFSSPAVSTERPTSQVLLFFYFDSAGNLKGADMIFKKYSPKLLAYLLMYTSSLLTNYKTRFLGFSRHLGFSILLFWVSNTYGQEMVKKNVLFIGNSLTYYSGMPEYLKAMLRSTNQPIEVDVSAYPGMSLESHLDQIVESRTEDSINTRKKKNGEQTETEKIILSKKWDIVILQEQPVRVLISEFRKRSTEMSIERLKKLIGNPTCRLILFKTWASTEAFPIQFCYPAFMLAQPVSKEKYCSKKFNSVGEIFSSLSVDYDSVASATTIGKVSIGDVYDEARRRYPTIELYDKDGHPTKFGAYLNAYIFYKLLLDGKAALMNYYGDLGKENAVTLQQLAN